MTETSIVISELVKELEDFRALYGDIQVCLNTPRGTFDIKAVRLSEGHGKIVILQAH